MEDEVNELYEDFGYIPDEQDEEEVVHKKKKKRKSKKEKNSQDWASQSQEFEEFVDAEEFLENPQDTHHASRSQSPKKKRKKKKKSASPEPEELPVATSTPHPDPKPSTSKGSDKTRRSNKAAEIATTKSDDKVGRNKKSKGSGSDGMAAATVTDEQQLSRYGMNIILAMSNDDLEELLSRVDIQCPQDDIKQIRVREGLIDWDKVTFSSYGPQQCKAAWHYLKNNCRKYRIMHEIVQEVQINLKLNMIKFKRKIVESSPDYPHKPHGMGAFQLFCKEKWDQYKAFQEKMNAKVTNFLNFQTQQYEIWTRMSSEEKKNYEITAKENVAAYQKKVKEFYALYPAYTAYVPNLNKNGKRESYTMSDYKKKLVLKFSKDLYKDAPELPLTPQKLFMNSKLNRLDPPPTADELPDLKSHYIEKWKTTSRKKKLKWIECAIRQSERYMEEVREYKKTHPMFLLPREFQIWRIIPKAEFEIWSEAHGKPPKPKVYMFEIFLEEFTNSGEVSGTNAEIKAAALAKWESMDWYHKEMYRMQYKMQKMNYRRDIVRYFSQVPQILKRSVLEAYVPRKFHALLMSDVDKEPLVLDDEEPTSSNQETKNSVAKSSRKRARTDVEDSTEQGPSTTNTMKELNQSNPALPLYMVELTYDHKQFIEKKLREERAAARNAAKEKGSTMAHKLGSGDTDTIAAALVNQKQPPKAELYSPGKDISPRILSEAIRGVFDGLQNIGRCFSVYYYYAKYVARERSWVALYTKVGVVDTASRIIETFHRLPKNQQQVFIDESFQFHKLRYYGSQNVTVEDVFAPRLSFFPEEPKPPPGNAVLLYNNEMALKKLETPKLKVVKWEQLDEKTQMKYMRKLYKVTRNYVQDYEEFVRRMTPNDMVQYLIQRCQDLDTFTLQYKGKALNVASRDCVHPFIRETYAAELSDDGQDSEPEVYEANGNLRQRTHGQNVRYLKNPFANQTGQTNFIRKLSSKRADGEGVDSDLPSSSSSDDDKNLYSMANRQRLKQKELRRRLKRLSTYYYPLDDLYEEPVIKSNKDNNCALKRAQLQLLHASNRANTGNLPQESEKKPLKNKPKAATKRKATPKSEAKSTNRRMSPVKKEKAKPVRRKSVAVGKNAKSITETIQHPFLLDNQLDDGADPSDNSAPQESPVIVVGNLAKPAVRLRRSPGLMLVAASPRNRARVSESSIEADLTSAVPPRGMGKYDNFRAIAEQQVIRGRGLEYDHLVDCGDVELLSDDPNLETVADGVMELDDEDMQLLM